MSEPLVRPIAAGDTHALRQRVLRPGRPLAEVDFAGDGDPDTVHLGAFLDDGTLVAVGSLYREDRPETAFGGGYRLRGMAVEPERRGQGHGAAIVDACVEHAAGRGGMELWCNARTSAAGFYSRQGFDTEGPPFEIPGIGPHFVMRKALR